MNLTFQCIIIQTYLQFIGMLMSSWSIVDEKENWPWIRQHGKLLIIYAFKMLELGSYIWHASQLTTYSEFIVWSFLKNLFSHYNNEILEDGKYQCGRAEYASHLVQSNSNQMRYQILNLGWVTYSVTPLELVDFNKKKIFPQVVWIKFS